MTPDSIIELAINSGCKGICYTYNEPAVMMDAIERISRTARKKGLFNVLVTNSTLTPTASRLLACYIDVVAADIKSCRDEFFYEYCGASGIPEVAGKILACIKAFHEAGCHIEIRTNIIPGANDRVSDFREIANWMKTNLGASIPWHITRFFPAHYLKHLKPTPASTMLEAQDIGLKLGLKYVNTFFSKGCDCARDEYLKTDLNPSRTQFSKPCCN